MVFVLLFDQKIKIVHIHGASRGSFYRKYIVFYISKYIFGKRVVYHLHSGEFHIFYESSGNFIKRRIQHLTQSVDLMICLSTHWYDYLGKNFKAKRLVILNNPVELPVVLNHHLDRNPVVRFLYLGLIVDKKGVFDLLAVIDKRKKDWNETFKLVIGGDGENDRLKTIIKENRLSKIVEFVGWVSGKEKATLLAQCDVLILPSYNEGLPISILEAMSYEKAILSTNVGGIPAVVADGHNGYLFEPGNLSALENKINMLLEHPDKVVDMGVKSLAKVKPYLVDNVLEQMNKEYQSLLN
ncbi:MAG TPA: glycosyl transferase family 1 [Chryseobacterium sp.]|nr:glycosyl transferase family 1 [Chryseobacterium sp.]